MTTTTNNDLGTNWAAIIWLTLGGIGIIGGLTYLMGWAVLCLIPLVVSVIFLAIATVFAMANSGKFFAYFEKERYSFLESGGRITEVVYESKKEGVNPLLKRIGNPRWIGVYPFVNKRKEITIKVTKVTDGTTLVVTDKKVSSLYKVSPMDYLFKGLETAGGETTVDMLVTITMVIESKDDAYYGIVTLDGKMYYQSILFIQEWLNDKVRATTVSQWFGMNKAQLLEEFFKPNSTTGVAPSDELYKKFKVKVTSLDLSASDPASKAIVEALQAKTIAEKQGDADKAKALADKQVTITKAEGRKRELELEGEGERKRLKEMFPDATDQEILEYLKVEKLAEGGNTIITGSGGSNALINITPKNSGGGN